MLLIDSKEIKKRYMLVLVIYFHNYVFIFNSTILYKQRIFLSLFALVIYELKWLIDIIITNSIHSPDLTVLV